MAIFNEPTKWAQTLGQDADVVSIPDTAGATDPSIDKIFPSVFSIPLAQGGRAIPRSVLNGLFKLVGDWSFYQQNGGLASYSADFDYTVGRVVLYNDNIYKCIQNNGASSTVVAPDSDDSYWQQLDKETTALLPNQIIVSPVPMSDANLHLLDGALLSGSGTYADYVTMMISLYNSDTSASCWTDEATWQSSVSTYGECGKFVVDTVNNTVRLPKLGSFIQSATTATELGNLVEAGVPEIYGSVAIYNSNSPNAYTISAASGACSVRSSDLGNSFSGTISTNQRYGKVYFNASAYNPIYGNSNTVQPQAIKYYHYIVLGTVSKTQIQIDIDNVLTDLNGKADTDLSNINNTAKIAIAHNAMPSTKYDTLTAVSGQSYTAPADGYFQAGCLGTANGQRIQLSNTSTRIISSTFYSLAGQYNMRIYIPVKKGDVVNFSCSSSSDLALFFIYAVGSESEQ